jgi:glucose-6-phosphate isomerase
VDITTTPAWSVALACAQSVVHTDLQKLFALDPTRAERMSVSVPLGNGELFADFSKQNLDDASLGALLQLVEQSRFVERRSNLFEGVAVNNTENQAALHTALRAPAGTAVEVNGNDVIDEIHRVRAQITTFAQGVRSGSITGATGKHFRSVINVGIGGSDLGPVLVWEALSSISAPAVQCHFVSNIDPVGVRSAIAQCDPETTLVVLCSKSFSTAETLSNGRILSKWLGESLGQQHVSKHLCVVSVFPDKATTAGLAADYVFPMWAWVGGRYSVASAVNVVNVIAFGPREFDELLAGMHAIDDHFLAAPPERNAPVLMGAINVWNRSLLDRETRAMVAYSTGLRSFAPYVQQLEMESNGKRVTRDGQYVNIETSPVVWGGVGTNAQHAYMQLLHQGTSVVPVDFIGVAATPTHDLDAHDALVANMFAQSQALAFGHQAEPHRTLPGNRPSTTLLLSSLSARTVGALIALYEHSVFVQGCIFGINSFDQWGVELGKKLASEVRADIDAPTPSQVADSSTSQLVQWYKNHRRAT